MFVDTSVLVAARFLGASHHDEARAALDRFGEQEPMRLSRQVLREYLAVVTRAQKWSEPLGMPTALADVRRLILAFDVLAGGPHVMDLLVELCGAVRIGGKQVHDANIVATMLAHGERRLLTLNTRDFRRFGDRIELLSP